MEVTSPVGGLVATPRLKEKVGQYLREGDLICEVEAPDVLGAEIAVAEQDGARVRPGQAVALKARALPFATFRGRVERVAPRAAKAEKTDAQATVTVYCRLEGRVVGLSPGMTGYARIGCGWRSAGELLMHSVLRVVRTEFWW
jgi:multidrug resistance efflux pump